MTSAEMLAIRALTQAASKMAEAASSPTVMVKHGRREDRALVYDRFIGICAAFYQSRDHAGSRVPELFAALHALNLRAPKRVRDAAETLFIRIVGEQYDPEALADWMIPVDDNHPSVAPHVVKEVWLVDPSNIAPPEGPSTSVIASSFELKEELDRFTDIARTDVNRQWWHWTVTSASGDRAWWRWLMRRIPFVRRRWQAR
ncbi:hypothetical protein ACFQ6B_40990 [Streptomyces wedmorensis]|uniref:Uncharacterized protein n=1 Tax=Streptomyces wedmorensis TaxID=43759 RepID=A0ABW6J6K1_STRWE